MPDLLEMGNRCGKLRNPTNVCYLSFYPLPNFGVHGDAAGVACVFMSNI